MRIDNLSALKGGESLDADLVIVGSGPVGLSLAREFFGTPYKVLVLESGIQDEKDPYNDLLSVESGAAPLGEAAVARRISFHGSGAKLWSHEAQAYGLRCRVMGGSSHAWAGKSALFDPIDFEARPWVDGSGWPISRQSLAGYFDRAAEHLNLGPNTYNSRLFDLAGIASVRFSPMSDLESFFWQFSRSRRDKMDVMRFGPDFAVENAGNVRVLIDATVTHVNTSASAGVFESLEISTLSGERQTVKAKVCVLATGGIENARLLLASNRVVAAGVGNSHDQVGRYLMDHLGVRLGYVPKKEANAVVKAFGFYGVRGARDVHMYQHGMRLTDEVQRRRHLLNCAGYILEDRALDDPWDATKRLLKGQSRNAFADAFAIVKSPGLLIKGAGVKLLGSRLVPEGLKSAVVNTVLKLNPGLAVSEFQSRGLPHKLKGLLIDAIVEQPPYAENRITLSQTCDALGMPRAVASWNIRDAELQSLMFLARSVAEELPKMGLSAPLMEDWVQHNAPSEAPIIDMGHTSGTTRMSEDPRSGVVDANCEVHDTKGLFVAGSSVFPTSGHANPTLMAVAFAVRLADYLKMSGRLDGLTAAAIG